MTELENIGKLAATASELLNAIRGGEIANMKAEHTQTLEEFVTAYNAKINEFTQQKGEALNQFNQEKAQAFAAADAQLQQRRAAVDAVLGDLAGHTRMNIHYYDSAIHTKQSLAVKADPSDSSKSEWIAVPIQSGYYDKCAYSVPNTLAQVHLKTSYSFDGGYPDYSTDKSRSYFEFVIAQESATSQQINDELARLGKTPVPCGGWDYSCRTHEIDVLDASKTSDYRVLFVRFVNRAYRAGEVPQNIEQFGGNAKFSVERAVNYPLIAK